MIDYTPFWETLENSKENWYTLTEKHGIGNYTLTRLKHNQDISMQTLNKFCKIFNCQVQDLIRYIPDDEEKK